MLAKIKQFFLRRAMKNIAGKHKVQTLPEDVKSIAIWQFGGLGDMLLATPVIIALSNQYPQADIHIWCSFPKFSAFLHRFPQVKSTQTFLIYDFDMRTLLLADKRRELQSCMSGMRAQDIDLLINLHIPKLLDWWVVEWSVLAQLKPRYALGFTPEFIQGSIFDVSLPSSSLKESHYTQSYQHLLKKISIDGDRRTHFPICQVEQGAASALLHDVENKHWVCLHMGGRRLKFEDKMWDMDNFVALAQKFVNDDIMPVLIGVESEWEMGSVLCQKVPQAINLIGKTSMGEMAAVVNKANLFVGHDSGPFHIAVAVQTPAVVICGRPDAEPEYLKYDQNAVLVLTADSPSLIAMRDVYDAAKELI
ncbi:MAG: glycosyltransferase family 9 protein [Mariprofundaceae bacterium]